MTDFDSSFSAPPKFTGKLPDAVDTVVIGGGIIGVMTAWFLCKAGQKVLLCEKGRIACEQSSRNWGWVRQQGRDASELPIMVEALRHWHDLRDELGDGLGFRQRGIMYLADTEKELAKFETWLPHAKANSVDTKMLGSSEVAKQLNGCSLSWKGAMFTPSDARAEPWKAVPAIADALSEKGAFFREDCAVRCLDMRAGRLSGVVTEHGTVRCENVVLAGGAWSSLFLRNHGVSIPQLSVRASVGATSPVAHEIFAGAAEGQAVAFRRREDGGYTLAPGYFHELFIGPDAFRTLPYHLPAVVANPFGTRYKVAAPKGYPDAWSTVRRWSADETTPFEKMRVLNPAPNTGVLEKLLQDFQRLFPWVGDVSFKKTWAGMIDVMPDEVPIVDHIGDVPGLFLATGMTGHGFGIGPGFGRVIADMVMGRDAGHDMTRFRFGRFRIGSVQRADHI